jgi:NAD(P)-dependent dehydrogenase (short-subunit alcohol dehydrogenase family)
MKKKTVIITGGTTGIGKATAIAFARKGYNIVITSRNEKRGAQTLNEIKETGAEVEFMKLNVSNEQEFVQIIEDVVQKFGKLDVLVNNAGISGEQSGFLADSTGENLRALFDTNILGLFFGMKYSIKAMLKTGGGSVINLASIAGLNGLLYSAQYCASKHAVVGLTKAAAVEYATQGVRVNAIAPGAIKTDILQNAIDSGSYSEESIAAIHPMKRMGTPEDIANGIVFLASDDCPFMTGTILSVDGGYNAQ